MSDLSNKLAVKIFDALYDDEDLKELEQKNVIAQALGFKLSTIAIIECEIKEQLQQDKAELVEALKAVAIQFHSKANSEYEHLIIKEAKVILEKCKC